MEYVKIYISSDYIESTEKIAEFSFAEVVKRYKVGEIQRSGFQDEMMIVKPIKEIPEEVHFYRERKQVKLLKGKLKIHKRELKPNAIKQKEEWNK